MFGRRKINVETGKKGFQRTDPTRQPGYSDPPTGTAAPSPVSGMPGDGGLAATVHAWQDRTSHLPLLAGTPAAVMVTYFENGCHLSDADRRVLLTHAASPEGAWDTLAIADSFQEINSPHEMTFRDIYAEAGSVPAQPPGPVPVTVNGRTASMRPASPMLAGTTLAQARKRSRVAAERDGAFLDQDALLARDEALTAFSITPNQDTFDTVAAAQQRVLDTATPKSRKDKMLVKALQFGYGTFMKDPFGALGRTQ